MPEPVLERSPLPAHVERPSVPAVVRRPFLLAALAVLSSWSIGALFFSLGPQLAAQLFDTSNVIVSGSGIVALAAAAAIAQLLTARTARLDRRQRRLDRARRRNDPDRRSPPPPTPAAAYLAGSILGGAGFGAAFLGGLRALVTAIPPEHRAAVMSAFYVAAYASLSVPAVLAGVVVTHISLRVDLRDLRQRRRRDRPPRRPRSLAHPPHPTYRRDTGSAPSHSVLSPATKRKEAPMSNTNSHGTPIEGAVALVTGGNRGFGRAMVQELLDRGAAKVYATSRSPQPQTDARIVPLVLDVTDDDSVAAAARAAADVSIVVNNAGVLLQHAGARGATRRHPRRARDQPVRDHPRRARVRARPRPPPSSSLVNVLSVLSWLAFGSGYEISKAAAWSATNSMRSSCASRARP